MPRVKREFKITTRRCSNGNHSFKPAGTSGTLRFSCLACYFEFDGPRFHEHLVNLLRIRKKKFSEMMGKKMFSLTWAAGWTKRNARKMARAYEKNVYEQLTFYEDCGESMEDCIWEVFPEEPEEDKQKYRQAAPAEYLINVSSTEKKIS